jgi:hypothetical protein
VVVLVDGAAIAPEDIEATGAVMAGAVMAGAVTVVALEAFDKRREGRGRVAGMVVREVALEGRGHREGIGLVASNPTGRDSEAKKPAMMGSVVLIEAITEAANEPAIVVRVSAADSVTVLEMQIGANEQVAIVAKIRV